MDVVELVWVMVSVLFLVAGSVFFMWYNVPANKAYLKRTITKKNWVVVTIRHGGGQLKEHVICTEGRKKGDEAPPTFNIKGREYLPIEKVTRREVVTRPDGSQYEREVTDSIVNFKASVPVYFYNFDDAKPVALSGVDIEKKFRNPALLNSIFMQVQALYRTKVAKEIAALMTTVGSWDMRIWAILAVSGVACIVSLYNLIQLQQVQSTVITVGNILNQSVSQVIQNQLPYG